MNPAHKAVMRGQRSWEEGGGVIERGVDDKATFHFNPAGSTTCLLHQHVYVRLCSIQDVSVWVLQPLHGVFHCGAINVDPPWGAAGQKRPGIKTRHENQNINIDYN